MRNNTQFNFF